MNADDITYSGTALAFAIPVTVERRGQEWVKPLVYRPASDPSDDMRHLYNDVAVETSVGWLILAWVEVTTSCANAGQVRYMPVKPEELHTKTPL